MNDLLDSYCHTVWKEFDSKSVDIKVPKILNKNNLRHNLALKSKTMIHPEIF